MAADEEIALRLHSYVYVLMGLFSAKPGECSAQRLWPASALHEMSGKSSVCLQIKQQHHGHDHGLLPLPSQKS